MDLKTLKFAPTHEWVLLRGQYRDGRNQQVRRRSIDRLDHDRAAGRRHSRRRWQELRRNREREGRQRPVRAARQARSIEVNSQVTSNVSAPGGRPLRQGMADQDQGRPTGRHIRLDGPGHLRDQRWPRKAIDRPIFSPPALRRVVGRRRPTAFILSILMLRLFM